MASEIRGNDNFDSLLGAVVDVSLTQDGYIEFGNGLIVQWGQINGNSTTSINVTYPIPFPNNVLRTIAQNGTASSNSTVMSSSNSGGTSSFTIYGSVAFSHTVGWIAIGY